MSIQWFIAQQVRAHERGCVHTVLQRGVNAHLNNMLQVSDVRLLCGYKFIHDPPAEIQ